ncbi:YiiX/YebB-like N1pC/P60 family cysteine hydrolase [Caenimonas aquaedulcis]|uniref:Distant relative of cell wall-associated hydrolase n=1 Tax=Caenimonas aquaedulcis TaxID=2793270 RepID=A0A931MG05_9BURK|nr:YiiX/YebB-like N1pC/P60 family cysteine hydrolase [Caenimonas aquaedulcis]MBG9386885.1 distant relative of cell wall-associated hydrolase [Caenimonas aquaedulcis]
MSLRLIVCAALLAALAGCATDVRDHPATGRAQIVLQNPALNPRNGGVLVDAASLQPGDILLSSADGITSAGIRLLTLSPVSHASIYIGGQKVAEAVGEGIRQRTVEELLAEESTVVAFRHPGVSPEHASRMQAFAREQTGSRYNVMGVMLQAPFSIERRLCELPLLPSPLRDFCVQGVAAVQLGLGSNDRFFCSQFVLEAYRRAGLPLTDADPRMISPGDLMHMREGDVPSVRTHQALHYLGHLKFQPAVAAARL